MLPCVLSGFSSSRRAPPPPRVPAKVPAAVPAHPPAASSAVGAAQPRQPGLLANMASTAVGVGIGSAVVSNSDLYFTIVMVDQAYKYTNAKK